MMRRLAGVLVLAAAALTAGGAAPAHGCTLQSCSKTVDGTTVTSTSMCWANDRSPDPYTTDVRRDCYTERSVEGLASSKESCSDIHYSYAFSPDAGYRQHDCSSSTVVGTNRAHEACYGTDHSYVSNYWYESSRVDNCTTTVAGDDVLAITCKGPSSDYPDPATCRPVE